MVQFRLATSRPLILLESLGSISLVTVPLWRAIFFFLGGLFPTPGLACVAGVERGRGLPRRLLPGTQKKTIPKRPSSWLTSYTFSATAFLFVQEQNDAFSQLSFLTFSWVYWKEVNGWHNVVKTWTINLKTKTKTKKKNNCLMRLLDRTLHENTGPNLCFSIVYIKSLVFVFI